MHCRQIKEALTVMFLIGFLTASFIALAINLVVVIKKQNKEVLEKQSANRTFSETPKGLRELNQYRYQYNAERSKELKLLLRHVEDILKDETDLEYPKNHPVFSIIRTLTMNIQTQNDLNILKQNNDNIIYDATPNSSKSFHYTSSFFYFLEEITRKRNMINQKQFIVNMERPLLIRLETVPVISVVWRSDRLINALKIIGKDVKEKNNFLLEISEPYVYKTYDFEEDTLNHFATYLFPLGMVWVHNGNHSINAGILKSEGEINVKEVYDMRFMYDHYSFDGTYLTDSKYDEKIEIQFEFGALFEIGRILLDYPELFPKEIKEEVIKRNKKSERNF